MTDSPTGQSADLDATIAALEGGITSLPPDVALSNLASWQQQLEGTEVARLLGELKAALSGASNNRSVGMLLSELGTQVTQAAETTSGEVAVQLRQLGQLLSQSSTLP